MLTGLRATHDAISAKVSAKTSFNMCHASVNNAKLFVRKLPTSSTTKKVIVMAKAIARYFMLILEWEWSCIRDLTRM